MLTLHHLSLWLKLARLVAHLAQKRNTDFVLVGKCVKEIKEESYRRLEDGGKADHEEV